jgi:hypothetical protein
VKPSITCAFAARGMSPTRILRTATRRSKYIRLPELARQNPRSSHRAR